jgi:hypothetical protein
LAEAFASYRLYGLPVELALPRTFVAVTTTVNGVVDLCDAGIRRSLALSRAALLEVDWRIEGEQGRLSPSQIVGKAAYEAGLEGLIVPSAADPVHGRNLVLFPGNFGPDSVVQVLNPDQLA